MEQADALQEELKRVREECDRQLNDWRSAAEVDNAEALRTWRRELMLGHEVELEQMKLENEAELEEARQWHQKYETLFKETESRVQQVQEDLQHKHRLELEGSSPFFHYFCS